MINFKPGDTRETIFLFISDTGGSEEKNRATCFIVNSALLKIITLSHLVIIVVEQWWRIFESTLLPRTYNRGLCSERFSPRYSGFPLPSKTCIWLEQSWLSWPMRGFQSARSLVRRRWLKRGTDRGRGVKGAPSASIDTSFISEGTTDVA